ncbi:MAG: ribose-phosphate diphosphokinase [Candidatus Bathyarchaeia archaeon]
MIIIPGPTSKELAVEVARLSGASLVDVKSKTFPDGEVYVRILGKVEGEDIVIVHTTAPSQNTRLLELFLLIDAARDIGAKSVTAVVPYLAYARQDKRFLRGEAVSIDTIIRILNNLSIDRFITFNTHDERSLKKFSMEVEDLSAFPLLAKYFKGRGLDGALAFAPDQGAVEGAREASEVLGGGFGWIVKERDRETGEIQFEQRELDVQGRRAIVFDDIISTGGTVASATAILNGQGAKSVYVGCVHPLLVGDALYRIMREKVRGIVGTDSVPSPVSIVSLAPLIAEEIKG